MAEAVTVLVHEPGWSEEELLVNPQSFPDVKVDDYLELVSPDDPECSVVLRVRSLSDVKGNMQVSILKDVAQVLSHLHGQKLIVRPANLASHALDFGATGTPEARRRRSRHAHLHEAFEIDLDQQLRLWTKNKSLWT